jgi:chromosome segregation ATPase
MSSDAERLQQIQSEFDELLEIQLTDLLTQVKAAQSVTARIASLQTEIHRQDLLRESLERDVDPLNKHAQALESDNDKLTRKVQALRQNVRILRSRRQKQLTELKGLSAEAKSLSSKT